MDGQFSSKDVDGDYGYGPSHLEPEDMVRAHSNFSLGEVDDSGTSSEVNGQKDNQSLCFLEFYKNGAAIGQQPEELIGGATVVSKGASFKEVQWNAFSINSQQFGLGDYESDFLFGAGDCVLVNSEPFSESKSPLIENTSENKRTNEGSYEQHDAQLYNSVGEQSAGLKEMKNSENLYPGWSYDTNAGQCYELDDYNATGDTQSDNFYIVSTNTQRSNEAKVHNTSEGSILEIPIAMNLKQTSLPGLETNSEVNSISKSRNQVSQDNQDYPSHMVFNPQYPEWYYDTIKKMWCTLESYNDDLQCASNTTQGPPLSTDDKAIAEVQNASDGSASEMRDVVNLQQTSHPVLETVFEESCVLNSRNQYPPNMVFDPQYPEWYYDMFTQSWHTLESYNHAVFDASKVTQDQFAAKNALDKVQNAFEGPVPEILDAANLQQNSQSVLEAISEKTSVFSSNNKGPQDSICYTPSMVFDPQYPGWYYDTISQMWHTLESYNHALHDASNATQGLVTNNANVLAELSIDEHSLLYGSHVKSGQSAMLEKRRQKSDWNASTSGFNEQSLWEEKTGRNGHWNASGGGYGLPSMWQEQTSKGSHTDKQFDSINLEPILKLNYGRNNLTSASSYVSSESSNHVNQPNMKLCANSIYSPFSYTPNEVRSTAGRPPHALVTFGFGGKIIVMRDDSFSNSSLISGSQGSAGGVVLIHTLVDVVMTKPDFLNTSVGYFHALCHESFPGPLVGGNAASKEINKWINDRIKSSESSSMDFRNGLLLKLLLSLLKILCQHNGRLRSPYGINPSHEGSDGPESAVSNLFASSKRSNAPVGGGSSMHCMRNPPSEANIRATATEVQNFLVSGRRKKALQCAQEGELWGTAVVLAAQLGEQFYADTVKQMALRQFVFGSPLRTLYLLISGQPADVFSADSSTIGSSGAVNRPYQCSEVQPNGLLDDWQDNLAIIASNRTKDDELVIIHIGDSLWKERGEVTAAHACYLLAEVNFEPYSDSARLCLIGADHWKNTRTYACPDSIQRTEIYEYSKVLGNSQFVLLPFQPYKLVYAYMLAEVGNVSDSLRYCQASMKLLKYSGRSPEIELWRALFSSLEERLRNYQQSGYSTSLTPTKLVGKLFNSIDRSIHRMIGLPPLPPMLPKSEEDKDNNSRGQKVSNSQSAMAITSLMSSPSIEAVSEWTGDSGGKDAHNRSISEPDFRNTRKNGGSYGQGNASISGGPSRFGRFGFKLLQKTIGWVSRTRPDRQAKLGESNKFYYDEKLKRWVEEGAVLPASEAFLPPPPTAASFQNGKSDYDVKNVLKSDGLIMDTKQETQLDALSEQVVGLPPVPPSQNQFSARNRGGVRSRYVDTFNKRDGFVTSPFLLPSAPSVKPLSGANFFIPSAPANHEDQTSDASTISSTHETTIAEDPFTFAVQESIFSPPST